MVMEQVGRIVASPRARKAARERGIDVAALTGSGPHGRIVERDVLAARGGQANRGDGGRVIATPGDGGRVIATPMARRAAADLGVELSVVRGSGPGGRVVEADVRRVVAVADVDAGMGHAQADAIMSVAVAHPIDAEENGEIVPLTTMRRVTAARMAESARGVARVTLFMDVDATEMVRLRGQLAPEFEHKGVHLSYDVLIARGCALALAEFPHLNAAWVEGQGVRRYARVHIGVAVALEPEGLVVPVLRDTADHPLLTLARSLGEMVARARAGALDPAEMRGGTFTITNLGNSGIRAFTPIVNPPQAGILGVGAIRPTAAFVEGRWEPRSELTLSLSFDHRVIDGFPAARFLARLRDLLQRPYALVAAL